MSVPSCGHEPSSGLYWERLGEGGAATPRLFIHGGGATGACWRVTPDGRAGWVDLLVAGGVPCWVTDWPGCGRSGGPDPVGLTYEDLWRGYLALLEQVIAEPVVVVCHSMGGAITWKLAELAPQLVAGVVAVAASYPGNIAPTSEVIAEDEHSLTVHFQTTGLDFRAPRDRPYRYDDTYIFGQGLSTSTRFPRERIEEFRAGLVGISPLVLHQRLGLAGGLPAVADTAAFAGLPVRLLAGTEDPAHGPEVERATAKLLSSWGAEAEVVMLGEHGVEGNGHFLMAESNSDQILRDWVAPFPECRTPSPGSQK